MTQKMTLRSRRMRIGTRKVTQSRYRASISSVFLTLTMPATPPSDEEMRRVAKEQRLRREQIAARRRQEDREEELRAAEALRVLEERHTARRAREAVEKDAADRKRRREEEDERIRRERDVEDAKAAEELKRKVAGKRRAGAGMAPAGASNTGTRKTRGSTASMLPRTNSLGDAPRPRDPYIMGRRSLSVASSVPGVETFGEAIVIQVPRKRGADDDNGSRSTSNSSKHQCRVQPLHPGQTCKRCRIMGYVCEPPTPGTRKLICAQCRRSKAACKTDDGMDAPRSIAAAALDSAWRERGRAEGAEPSDRVYGPVSDPLDGFDEPGSELWGRWMDINTRIHLQVAEAVERLRIEVAIERRATLLNAQANMLSALVSFRTTAADRRANDPGWYDILRRDFHDATGQDLGPDGGSFPWSTGAPQGDGSEGMPADDEELPAASGSGHEEEVDMGEPTVPGELEDEDDGDGGAAQG